MCGCMEEGEGKRWEAPTFVVTLGVKVAQDGDALESLSKTLHTTQHNTTQHTRTHTMASVSFGPCVPFPSLLFPSHHLVSEYSVDVAPEQLEEPVEALQLVGLHRPVLNALRLLRDATT